MSFTRWLSKNLGLSSQTPGRASRPASKRKAPGPRRTLRPYLENLEDRLCLSTLIDAQALTMPYLALDSATSFSTADVFSADLSPGSHTLNSAASQYGGSVAFSVDSMGIVSYDPTLEGVLAGIGSSTLTVNGAAVKIIPRAALTLPAGLFLNPNYVTNIAHPVGTEINATLLPGVSNLATASQYGGAVNFIIDNHGQVGYDPTLEGVLSGIGSSTLTVNGAAVKIIPSAALTLPAGLFLNPNNVANIAHPVGTEIDATLLPGVSNLGTASQYGGNVYFIIDNHGQVGYDPTLEGVLSGIGSSTLTVNGAAVKIILSAALTLPAGLFLNPNNVANIAHPVGTEIDATLLPGVSNLGSAFQYGGAVYFIIDNHGQVGYEPILEGVLSGTGSSTLTVNGAAVTFDPSAALTLPAGLVLNNDYDHPKAVGTPFSARLLPGGSRLESAGLFGFGGNVNFTIGNEGHFFYDPTLVGVLSGAGTSALVINGATVTINAQALTISSLQLNFGLSFATGTSFAITVLPGGQRFTPEVNHVTLDFSVNNSGALDYDPSLDGELSGRGTDILVFRGHSMTVTAADATYNGLPHGATAVVAHASLAGTTTLLYTGTGATVYSSSATPINAGTYHVVATFTPDDPSDYQPSSGSADYTIRKATLTGDATQHTLNLAQGRLTITVSDISGLANGDTLATFLSTAHYYITVGTIRYEFVPTTVTTSSSSIAIGYTLKNSALLGELGAALDAARSGKTAVTAGFDMESMNYTFTDEFLTRLFDTGH